MLLGALTRNRRISGALVIVLIVVVYYVMLSTRVVTQEKTPSGEVPHKVDNRAESGEKKSKLREPNELNKTTLKVTNADRGQQDTKDTHNSDETKVKEPQIFYSDCYAYSAAGKRPRSPEVLKRNGCEKSLPKAMIIGVKKCGTMMLTHFLSLHPLVVIRGEVEFPNGHELSADDVDKWRARMQLSSPRMFPMTGKPLAMDWRNDIPERLKYLTDQNAKLIMIIRDPVIRAVSDFVHTNASLVKMGSKDLKPFNYMVIADQTGEVNEHEPIIERGRYIRKFRQVNSLYGLDRLLIIDGEEFAQDPLPTMKKTEKFLGLRSFFEKKHFQRNQTTGFFCADVPERPNFRCANPTIKGRPHPKVDEEILKKLYEYYRPFNLELAREAGIDFPWLYR